MYSHFVKGKLVKAQAIKICSSKVWGVTTISHGQVLSYYSHVRILNYWPRVVETVTILF